MYTRESWTRICALQTSGTLCELHVYQVFECGRHCGKNGAEQEAHFPGTSRNSLTHNSTTEKRDAEERRGALWRADTERGSARNIAKLSQVGVTQQREDKLIRRKTLET